MVEKNLKLKDIYRIIKLCLTDENQAYALYFPIMALVFSIFFEVSSYFIMSVISGFYESISQQSTDRFVSCLWKSVCVVSLVSFSLSIKTYYVEMCGLQWREHLVQYLQNLYMKDKKAYEIVMIRQFENPDQRITQDAFRLTSESSKLYGKIIMTPFTIMFYTWYLWTVFGLIAPLACYVYFAIASFLSYVQARKIISYVYLQEALEGDFRYKHVTILDNITSITLLHGERYEYQKLEQSFRSLLSTIRSITQLHVPLNVVINLFSYLGGVGR